MEEGRESLSIALQKVADRSSIYMKLSHCHQGGNGNTRGGGEQTVIVGYYL